MITRCFTFGSAHRTPLGAFVRITAQTADGCRQEMFKRYGNKWSMEYSEEQIADQQKRFALYEVDAVCGRTWFVAGGRDERICGEAAECVCNACGAARCLDHDDDDLGFAEVNGRILCEHCAEVSA